MIVVVPVVRVVTLPVPLPTVATAGLEEVQVTAVVSSRVDPSVKVPVAMNCTVVPVAKEGLLGTMASETSTAGLTVNVVLADIVPSVAVIKVPPADTLVASPAEDCVLLMVATDCVAEVQAAVAVTSWLLPLLSVSVALNWTILPKGTDGLTGATRIAGTTTKLELCTVVPATVTEMGPVDAPRGTVTVRTVLVADRTAADVPLNVTAFEPATVLKFWPMMLTMVSTPPRPGVKLKMAREPGAGAEERLIWSMLPTASYT